MYRGDTGAIQDLGCKVEGLELAFKFRCFGLGSILQGESVLQLKAGSKSEFWAEGLATKELAALSLPLPGVSGRGSGP